jgi:hypothetical protein
LLWNHDPHPLMFSKVKNKKWGAPLVGNERGAFVAGDEDL